MPDIQFLFRSGPSNAGPWFPGIKPAWRDAFVCRPVLLRPASRGSIRLRSADPADPVRIHQNFLSDERDLPVLRAGLKLLRDVAAQPALDRFRGREIGPGAAAQERRRSRFLHSRQPAPRRIIPAERAGWERDEDAVVDPSLATAWRRRPSGGRCFGHAGSGGRQHQRSGDHDRGKSGRYDPGQIGARAGAV